MSALAETLDVAALARWKAASGFPLRLRFDASSVVWLEYGSQAFILDGRTAMANAVTVGELVESYIKHIARKGMRTAPVIACALRRDVVPRLAAGRAATEVTSLELRDVLEQIEARAPSAAGSRELWVGTDNGIVRWNGTAFSAAATSIHAAAK